MQDVMGLWTVLMEVMKAAAVSSSQIFIFLKFLHNKDLYFFLFGSVYKSGLQVLNFYYILFMIVG